jgi:hypothetical protein
VSSAATPGTSPTVKALTDKFLANYRAKDGFPKMSARIALAAAVKAVLRGE